MVSCDTSWLKLKGIGFIFWRTRRPREASVGFPSKHPGEIPPRTNSLVFCGWWEINFDLRRDLTELIIARGSPLFFRFSLFAWSCRNSHGLLRSLGHLRACGHWLLAVRIFNPSGVDSDAGRGGRQARLREAHLAFPACGWLLPRDEAVGD